MIGTIFKFGNEIVEVRVMEGTTLFRTRQYGGALAPLDGLKLNKEGCMKEFPDLKNNKEWKKESIKRLKKKISEYKTEKEKMDYIMKDLIKFGYKPLYIQKSGSRPIKIKD